MAMSSEEAGEAFRFLVEALREQRLGWVVAQVEEKLALGKLSTAKLQARETLEYDSEDALVSGVPRRLASKAAYFTIAEDYSPEERLVVLIDSILLAVPQIRLVAAHAIDSLRTFGGSDRLVFEPEGSGSEPFAVDRQEVEDRAEADRRLLTLLAELRGGDTHADQKVTSS